MTDTSLECELFFVYLKHYLTLFFYTAVQEVTAYEQQFRFLGAHKKSKGPYGGK